MAFKKGHKINNGRIFTQEHRDNLSKALTGNSNLIKACRGHQNTLGFKHTEETKQKMKKAHLGKKYKPMSDEVREKMSKYWTGRKKPWLVGKKLSEKHKAKLRESHIGLMSGENHWNWKGGVSRAHKTGYWSVEYKNWRNQIFERDSYTCQKTGIKGGKLHPHHIKNFAQFPKLRFIVDNGVTLLDKTHIEFHKIYGNKNNTRGQLEEFLAGVIKK